MRHRTLMLATTAAGLLLAGGALAADQPAAAAPAAPVAPVSWVSTIKFSGHVEAGATFNPAGPDSGLNFGRLFDDKANAVLLNQVALTLQRDLDPKATGVDFGFKVQGIYGSDARYTHFIGELDRVTSRRNQFDIIEANLLVHLPVLTPSGMDIKVGQYSTPIGVEVIDPTGNTFYSHSYDFNFGIPLKHTGILTITHVNPKLDIYAGYDTGVNTSIGGGGGDQAGRFHFLGGFALNLKNLTILALTHIGPELPNGALGEGVSVHGKLRYLNDVSATWKVNDKLTSITELNYIRDDGVNATGGGVVQYFTYALTGELTLALRGEVWRDNNGFFVAAFPGNADFINASLGLPNNAFGGGVVTYGAVTVGMNFKVPHMPKMLDGLVLRPELRYDRSLAGAHPFNGGQDIDQFTFGIDGVLPITF